MDSWYPCYMPPYSEPTGHRVPHTVMDKACHDSIHLNPGTMVMEKACVGILIRLLSGSSVCNFSVLAVHMGSTWGKAHG